MSRSSWIFLGAIALIATVATFIASSSPDGLERVAGDLDFEGKAVTVYEAPLPDYNTEGGGTASAVLSGLFGTVLVGGLTLAAGMLLARRT